MGVMTSRRTGLALAGVVAALFAAGCGPAGGGSGSEPPAAANHGGPPYNEKTRGGTGGGSTSAGVFRVIAGPLIRDSQGAPMSLVHHTATLLNDGKVLILGGIKPDPQPQLFANANFDVLTYDEAGARVVSALATAGSLQAAGQRIMTTPASPAWVAAQGLSFVPVWRWGHTATKLSNGDVAIIGGLGLERENPQNPGAPLLEVLRTIHLFRAGPRTFELMPVTLRTERVLHSAISLGNDRILIMGGQNNAGQAVAAAEVLNFASFPPTVVAAGTGPRGLVWAASGVTGGKPVQWGGIHTGLGQLQPLPGGVNPAPALFAGNATPPGLVNDPIGTIAAFGTPPTQKDAFGAGLAYAQVAARPWVGGGISTDGTKLIPGDAAYTVDDLTGAISQVGTFAEPRALACAAIINPQSGFETVIAGGHDMSGTPGQSPSGYATTAELWSAGNFVADVPMRAPRAGAVAVSLASGRVAVIGGCAGATEFMHFDGAPTPQIEIYAK